MIFVSVTVCTVSGVLSLCISIGYDIAIGDEHTWLWLIKLWGVIASLLLPLRLLLTDDVPTV